METNQCFCYQYCEITWPINYSFFLQNLTINSLTHSQYIMTKYYLSNMCLSNLNWVIRQLFAYTNDRTILYQVMYFLNILNREMPIFITSWSYPLKQNNGSIYSTTQFKQGLPTFRKWCHVLDERLILNCQEF